MNTFTRLDDFRVMKTIMCCLLICSLNLTLVTAQNESESFEWIPEKGINTSISLKATIDLALSPHAGRHHKEARNRLLKHSFVNLSAVLGIGWLPTVDSYVYPFIHVGTSIYTEGALASSYDIIRTKNFDRPAFELLFSPGFSAGIPIKDDQRRIARNNSRIPYFGSVYPSVLESPFGYGSVQMAWNRVLATNRSSKQAEHKSRFQSIGYVGATVMRTFSGGTYNDGSFMYWKFLPKFLSPGDGFDRYYTGGGHLALHLPSDKGLPIWGKMDLIEISGDRFTGHDPYTYSVGNTLMMHYLPKGNPAVRTSPTVRSDAYNKGRIKIELTDINRQFGFAFNLHNPDLDFQHLIHTDGKYTYHSDRFVKKDKNFWSKELCRLGFQMSGLLLESL